ncbi:MAG: hypothetical protein SOI38_07530 [Eggerthellaceae bacterium]
MAYCSRRRHPANAGRAVIGAELGAIDGRPAIMMGLTIIGT